VWLKVDRHWFSFNAVFGRFVMLSSCEYLPARFMAVYAASLNCVLSGIEVVRTPPSVLYKSKDIFLGRRYALVHIATSPRIDLNANRNGPKRLEKLCVFEKSVAPLVAGRTLD